MRLRIARLGVLLASVMGLVAGFAPPAEATTVASVVFAGHAHVNGGTHNTISYPCFEGLPPTIPPPIPDPLSELCLGLLAGFPDDFTANALTDKGIPHLGYTNDHNPSGFSFFSDIGCVAAGVNITKLTKLPVEAGICGVSAFGVVLGHCGLSSGEGSGTLGTGLVGTLQNYTFTILFVGIGGTLFINGEVTKNNGPTVGWLRGVAVAIVEPPDSCTNLNPLDFLVVGIATILIITP